MHLQLERMLLLVCNKVQVLCWLTVLKHMHDGRSERSKLVLNVALAACNVAGPNVRTKARSSHNKVW